MTSAGVSCPKELYNGANTSIVRKRVLFIVKM